MKNKKPVHFGKVLKKFRKERHMSQEELAYRSSLDRSYISALERELKNPTLDTIITLANGLGVKPSDLFIELENDPENLWIQSVLTHEWKNIQQDQHQPDFQV